MYKIRNYQTVIIRYEKNDLVAGVVITFNDAAETLTTNKHSRLVENIENMVIPPSTALLNQHQQSGSESVCALCFIVVCFLFSRLFNLAVLVCQLVS